MKAKEMKILIRNILNKTRRDTMNNQYIIEYSNVERITDWTNKRSREWDSRISRMDVLRLVKVVRNDKQGERRRLGKPREKMEG